MYPHTLPHPRSLFFLPVCRPLTRFALAFVISPRPPPKVTLRVAMTCGGCSGAVERIIKKMEGVEDYSVSLETQKVVVKGNVDPQKVLEAIAKSGKKTELWQ